MCERAPVRVLVRESVLLCVCMCARAWCVPGACARALADKLWLHGVVTCIQSAVRKWLARRRYPALMAKYTNAAICIQTMWRQVLVRVRAPSAALSAL